MHAAHSSRWSAVFVSSESATCVPLSDDDHSNSRLTFKADMATSILRSVSSSKQTMNLRDELQARSVLCVPVDTACVIHPVSSVTTYLETDSPKQYYTNQSAVVCKLLGCIWQQLYKISITVASYNIG